jgi:pre-mRNA-splicing factor 18
MDLLRAEIERKKAAAASNGNTKKRYLTASERRAIEEKQELEEEARERERQTCRRKRQRRGDSDDGEGENLVQLLTKKYDPKEKKLGREEKSSEDGGQLKRSDSQSSEARTVPETLKQLSPEEVTAALRRFCMPIRLFGESESDILNRLAEAVHGREAALIGEGEKDEFLLDTAHRTRNVFLEKEGENDDHDKPAAARSSKKETKINEPESSPKSHAQSEQEQSINDPPKQIYRYLKSLLRQWEADLTLRPDSIKRTATGKNETKTLKQCKDYIRPLFSMCKRRELDDNMQNHLLKIVTYCEQGEFVKAHDAYLDVAIGRAAWPIGVTMVGIHARSGREKIGSANVAHVMNSELHRKYLTSVKRLMSYDQKRRKDVDPSKKVMNL